MVLPILKAIVMRAQVGFFDLVAIPLFRSWCAVFNDALPMLKAVESNRNEWRKLESAGSLNKLSKSKQSSVADPSASDNAQVQDSSDRIDQNPGISHPSSRRPTRS